MLIKYVGSLTGPVDVPTLGRVVQRNETIEVSKEDGERLLAQPSNWKKATSKKKEVD